MFSKTLSNRLKHVLPEIMEKNHYTFVPERMIADNIVVAYEIMHYIIRKRNGAYSFGALKLDISKAYDKIEWGYLNQVLKSMGFSERFMKLVMMCVMDVKFKFLFGGQKLGPIVVERGLRQGCPLSPYLFILCAQGFSELIRKSEVRGLLHGLKVSIGAAIVSHLFFADGSYLFFIATKGEVTKVKRLFTNIQGSLWSGC